MAVALVVAATTAGCSGNDRPELTDETLVPLLEPTEPIPAPPLPTTLIGQPTFQDAVTVYVTDAMGQAFLGACDDLDEVGTEGAGLCFDRAGESPRATLATPGYEPVLELLVSSDESGWIVSEATLAG